MTSKIKKVKIEDDALPAIFIPTPFRKIPRRFEETKPAQLRDNTHERILELGEKIQQKAHCAFELQKKKAIQIAEGELWKKADELRVEAIQETLKKVTKLHHRELKRLKEEHEQVFSTEIRRIHQLIHLESLEEIARIRKSIEDEKKSLQNQLEVGHHTAVLEAVTATKAEEEAIRIEAVQKVVKGYEEQIVTQRQEQELRRQVDLKDLEERLVNEKEEVVYKVYWEQKRKGQEALKHEKELYDQNLRAMQATVMRRELEIERFRQELIVEREHKERIVKELVYMRGCFQAFVNDVEPFKPGYSDYLVPDIKSVEFT